MYSHAYFDHNATTAVDERVMTAMLPFMTSLNNASSRHAFGRVARHAIDTAREKVANAVGAHPSQIVFTSSGTEANNFAISGMVTNEFTRLDSVGNPLNKNMIISGLEHPCISRPALALKKYGFQVQQLMPNVEGVIEKSALETTLNVNTALVSVMFANNETGAIQPIAELAEIAKKHGTLIHTDGVQGFGKVAIDFADLNVHALTISSHKIGGPQGAGALVLDKRVDIQPLLYGGGQEKGLRSGTENVAAIVGFGRACELAVANLENYHAHTNQLRCQLEASLSQMNAVIFAEHVNRIPNTSFFAFEHIEGETLVMALDRKGFAVASGSACSSDSTEPSHVLLSMGIASDLARGAIRVSFGLENTVEQVARFVVVLEQELKRLKQMVALVA